MVHYSNSRFQRLTPNRYVPPKRVQGTRPWFEPLLVNSHLPCSSCCLPTLFGRPSRPIVLPQR